MEKKVLGSDAEQLRYEARLSADIVFGYPPHSSLPRIMFTVSMPSQGVRHATLKSAEP